MHVFPGFLSPVLTQMPFLSTNYFSHMYASFRNEWQKIAKRESLPHLGIKPTNKWSEVRYNNQLGLYILHLVKSFIEWCFTLISTVFQSYQGDSSHYSCFSRVSPVLGWGFEVSCPKTLQRRTQNIQCSLNPGPLNYESYTEPRRTPM